MRKLGFSLGIIASALVVGFSGAIFAAEFPGRYDSVPVAVSLQQRLPEQSNAPLPPVVPRFLPSLTAKAAYLSSEKPRQRPLLRHRVDKKHHLASITKLMTGLVLLSYEPDWNKEVVVEATDRRVGGRARIYPGERLTIGDLWKLALVASDNDAVIALVRTIADEQTIVAKMNELAKVQGFASLRFADPTGLAVANTGNARDVAALARIAFDEPRIAAALAETNIIVQVSGKDRSVPSSGLLLKKNTDNWQFVTGKTGYIDEAGYNVVLQARDSREKEILIVLLGAGTAADRAKEVDQLASWGLSVL